MLDLTTALEEAKRNGRAIGHFNISDVVALHGIFAAARELKLPVMIGTSEGERAFLGAREAVALVRTLREEYDYPIFLNADHTHSLEKIKEAVAAGYDEVLFDGSKLPWEENVKQTKEVVDYVKGVNPKIVVEGEIGYIGSPSEIIRELPAGAALRPEDLTSAAQAKEFVERTGVDMLAPAVGNIHGIFLPPGATEAQDPPLNIVRVKEIAAAVSVPLVLHGASGNTADDIQNAIRAGIRIVHINTELRIAWKRGLELGLKSNPDEVAPYKLLGSAEEEVKKVAARYLALFALKQGHP